MSEASAASMIISTGTTTGLVQLGVHKHRDYHFAQLPTQQHQGDIGFDLYACEDTKIPLHQSVAIETGIVLDIPEGYGVLMSGRSSAFLKRCILVHEGWIDQQYGDTIKVLAYGMQGAVDYFFDRKLGYYQIVKAGERVAQIRVVRTLPTELVQLKEHPGKTRKGLGSTGV